MENTHNVERHAVIIQSAAELLELNVVMSTIDAVMFSLQIADPEHAPDKLEAKTKFLAAAKPLICGLGLVYAWGGIILCALKTHSHPIDIAELFEMPLDMPTAYLHQWEILAKKKRAKDGASAAIRLARRKP